jgi:hypothetical protein
VEVLIFQKDGTSPQNLSDGTSYTYSAWEEQVQHSVSTVKLKVEIGYGSELLLYLFLLVC